MAQFVSLFREKLMDETWLENNKLNTLTEKNIQLFRRISRLEESLNSLRNIKPVKRTQYELSNKVNGSILKETYSSFLLHDSSDQRIFGDQKNLYYNLETMSIDKRLEAMEKKLRNLFVESNTSASPDVLNKYAVKIVTETYHPITTFNQHCTECYLHELRSCSHCLNHSARSNCTVQTVDILNKCQYIDKSVQTLCNESTTIVTYPNYFNEKGTITNENQIISKLKMNNQLTSFISPPNNHSHINQPIVDRDGISKDDDDNESVSKFTSSECLDIIVTPDFEMDKLKQTDYLKVQLNNNQQIGLDQMRQTQSFESGLNNEENYIDMDKIPATSRSYRQNKTFEPNLHYGTMEPTLIRKVYWEFVIFTANQVSTIV
ncbi:unnamed protein product [Schistosoma margrebowiei]|uniref:Uncharacterized protein n=1 Tax=Schistosoma margrebowiei TaxID=48269 RepID=A0AA85ACI1_9TREM|nr:unnamed protein product [Schistosoma margrebowiei]